MKHVYSVLLVICLTTMAAFPLQGFSQFPILSPAQGLPNSMIHRVTQDADGFLWLATYYGLYRYDGFEYKAYKSDVTHPTFLPSNNVVSLANDHQGGLWIGTHHGLCRLDKATNRMHHYPLAQADRQRTNDILITHDKQVYAATIRGLALYDEEADSLRLMGKSVGTGEVPEGSNLQALCEDTHGDILIATWGEGIYRYSPSRQHFIHYPPLNGELFFRSIYRDSKGQIWAISHGGGLFRLRFSSHQDLAGYEQIRPSENTGDEGDDYMLSICEDSLSHHLWAGTRHGFVTIDLNSSTRQVWSGNKLYPDFPQTEVLDIHQDREGDMWLSTKGSGVIRIPLTHRLQMASVEMPGERIASIATDNQGGVWIGSDYGVTYRNGIRRQRLLSHVRPFHISPISKDGHVLVATNDAGIYECTEGKIVRHYTQPEQAFRPNNQVYMVKEDNAGNRWIASYEGLSVWRADGSTLAFHTMDAVPQALKGELTAVCLETDTSVWVLSLSHGIIHLQGELAHPEQLSFHTYSLSNDKIPVVNPICMTITHDGRVWVGTEGGGLCVYNPEGDRFISVHDTYHLPGDMVASMAEDAWGNLWLGTNQGLACMSLREESQLHIYTTADGLPDNFFEPNAVACCGDTLLWGTGRGVVKLKQARTMSGYRPLVAVTDILIDGRFYSQLPADYRQRISPMQPTYTKQIKVPPHARSFTFCFAALAYEETPRCTYAYRLEGFDAAWHYLHGDERMANYTNLNPGTYSFQVKARNADGRWSEVHTLQVVVLPPWYATWWAHTVYALLACYLIYRAIRETRRRMMLKNKLHWKVEDGDLTVAITHKDEPTDMLQQGKQLSFEIKQLDYTNEDEEFLLKAIDCVNLHLSEVEFGATQLTEALAMSRSTLFKKLKALTGMNASCFIRSIRLKAACQMLDNHPGIRINELAFAVGFNDPKYFSSCFKTEFGILPSEYIKSKQES